MRAQSDEAPSGGQERALTPLLDHLAAALPEGTTGWQGWRIVPVFGGTNNRLYRVTRGGTDLAVKFTVRDARDRAGREYGALLALRRAGLDLAPQPVLIERARYPQPVVVQGWLAGRVIEEPPVLDDDWRALVEHLAAIHTLTPDRTALSLPTANLTMHSATEGRDRIREQLARIPAEARPPGVQALVAEIEDATFPSWPPPHTTLCRCDPNTSNFLRRDQGWASVDWENSGWGDRLRARGPDNPPEVQLGAARAMGVGTRAVRRPAPRPNTRHPGPRLRPLTARVVRRPLRPLALRGAAGAGSTARRPLPALAGDDRGAIRRLSSARPRRAGRSRAQSATIGERSPHTN